jgi:hypothetical protein
MTCGQLERDRRGKRFPESATASWAGSPVLHRVVLAEMRMAVQTRAALIPRFPARPSRPEDNLNAEHAKKRLRPTQPPQTCESPDERREARAKSATNPQSASALARTRSPFRERQRRAKARLSEQSHGGR